MENSQNRGQSQKRDADGQFTDKKAKSDQSKTGTQPQGQGWSSQDKH